MSCGSLAVLMGEKRMRWPPFAQGPGIAVLGGVKDMDPEDACHLALDVDVACASPGFHASPVAPVWASGRMRRGRVCEGSIAHLNNGGHDEMLESDGTLDTPAHSRYSRIRCVRSRFSNKANLVSASPESHSLRIQTRALSASGPPPALQRPSINRHSSSPANSEEGMNRQRWRGQTVSVKQ
jgi:hypothetical protein